MVGVMFESSEMSLRLIPTIFSSIEVIICIHKKLRTVDFHVVKVCDIENILALKVSVSAMLSEVAFSLIIGN